MRSIKKKNPDRWFGFLKPLPNETACVGLAFSRKSVWAAQTIGAVGKSRMKWCEKITFENPLFHGLPTEETTSRLTMALKPILEKMKDSYVTLQIALPDPTAHWEVFELDKVPAEGKAVNEFLAWRFGQAQEKTVSPLVFTSQLLGMEGNKHLFLGLGFDRNWLEAIQRAVGAADVRASVTDAAFHYRFNLFNEMLTLQKSGGALVTFEPDFWNLLLWDDHGRPRLVRSKWWNKPIYRWKDIPLDETILEVERTIRSHLSSRKNHSVENLFILAPQEWLDPIVEKIQKRTNGSCSGLSWNEMIQIDPKADQASIIPSALASAVRR